MYATSHAASVPVLKVLRAPVFVQQWKLLAPRCCVCGLQAVDCTCGQGVCRYRLLGRERLSVRVRKVAPGAWHCHTSQLRRCGNARVSMEALSVAPTHVGADASMNQAYRKTRSKAVAKAKRNPLNVEKQQGNTKPGQPPRKECEHAATRAWLGRPLLNGSNITSPTCHRT